MKVWLTSPFDPDGIEEREVTDSSTDAEMIFLDGDRGISYYWYIEGYSWHRTKEAAIVKAREHRASWIAQTTQEAARIASLPQIAE